MTELIITEKPSAAKKIAEALSDKKPMREKTNGVYYYKINHGGQKIYVVSAVGHLYTVAEKKKSFEYPSYDIQWVPTHEVDKKASFSKKYLEVIKKISKEADSFTVACDYDVEGEVIGLNVVRYACKQKDASRMKFSTLVKEDLISSYEGKMKSVDWGQALAGETRHFLDWLYGINLSRALTLAVKTAGSFKIMSSGRVQGPALKIVVDREKEIRAFKPEPYWEIHLKAEKDKKKIEAKHEKDKIWDKEEATKIYGSVKDEKQGSIAKIEKRNFKQAPPFPFDLGSLQSEAYRLFKIPPKATLQSAQNLYLKGVTSYPRTSSQKIPPGIGYKKILSALAKNPAYTSKANILLGKTSLKPNEGKKTDPAHPAIYPTGLIAKDLDGYDKKVYDLIVKRFLATFGEWAEKETITLKIKVKEEMFNAKGTKTVFKGWHELYEPYVSGKEDELPVLSEGETIKIDEIGLDEKETQPPKRYTPASLVSELEKRGLGTKATRADIVESLYTRGYIIEQSIQATEIGIRVETTLEKYVPEILDEELTKQFEEQMELIREQKTKPEEVLSHAKKTLTKILENFKSHEKNVGKELIKANKDSEMAKNLLGKCPVCKEGNIMIRKGKFGRFAACDKYPDCKTTFNLPKNVVIKPTDKVSPKGYPVIQVLRKGRGPQELSLNAEENSHLDGEEKKEVEDIKNGTIKKKCPKCGGDMRVMRSIYGEFLGCSNYPECKNTESIEQAVKEDHPKKD